MCYLFGEILWQTLAKSAEWGRGATGIQEDTLAKSSDWGQTEIQTAMYKATQLPHGTTRANLIDMQDVANLKTLFRRSKNIAQ
jgi:hypothetical protein